MNHRDQEGEMALEIARHPPFPPSAKQIEMLERLVELSFRERQVVRLEPFVREHGFYECQAELDELLQMQNYCRSEGAGDQADIQPRILAVLMAGSETGLRAQAMLATGWQQLYELDRSSGQQRLGPDDCARLCEAPPELGPLLCEILQGTSIIHREGPSTPQPYVTNRRVLGTFPSMDAYRQQYAPHADAEDAPRPYPDPLPRDDGSMPDARQLASLQEELMLLAVAAHVLTSSDRKGLFAKSSGEINVAALAKRIEQRWGQVWQRPTPAIQTAVLERKLRRYVAKRRGLGKSDR